MKSNREHIVYEVMDSKEERTLVVESDYVDYCEADICATIKEADGTWGPYAYFDGLVDGASVIEWARSNGFEMTEFAAEVATFVVDAALIVRDLTVDEAVSHKLQSVERDWAYDADQMVYISDDDNWLQWEGDEYGTSLYSLHCDDGAVWEYHADSHRDAIERANAVLDDIRYRYHYVKGGK